MKNILEIQKGDIITRVCEAKPYPSGVRDRSYMGDKLKLVGIANSQIYFQNLEHVSMTIFGKGKIFKVPFDLWEDGWDFYVEPLTLLNSSEKRDILEKRLQHAIDMEDYSSAEEIKKQIEEL